MDWNWVNLRGGKEEKDSNHQFGKLGFSVLIMMNQIYFSITRSKRRAIQRLIGNAFYINIFYTQF